MNAFVALLLFNLSVPNLQDVTLLVRFSNGDCSGTAVGQQVVLTAAHCLDEESDLVSIDGRPANIVSVVSDGQDHILVSVDIEFQTWAKPGPAPKQGDPLRWMGNPAGNRDFYREGYVVSEGPNAILIDGQNFKGDSGAGLFNHRGQLVGVISGAAVWEFGQMRMQLSVARPLAFTAEQWAAVK